MSQRSLSLIITTVLKLITLITTLENITEGAKSTPSFYLSFPSNINNGTVRLIDTIDTPLEELTICYRLRLRRPSNGTSSSLYTVFSYATEKNYNEFISSFNPEGRLDLYIKGALTTSLNQKIPFERWTHVCNTWESKTGINKYFVQGKKVASGNNVSMNTAVEPGGIIIIGQEQDTLGGGFDPTQAFHGDLKDLHLWSYVLCDSTIRQIAHCRQIMEGNVLSWNNLQMKLENLNVITSTSGCYNCEAHIDPQ